MQISLLETLLKVDDVKNLIIPGWLHVRTTGG
jgi:hypothetical protein